MDKQMTISLISDELRQAATPKKELLERMDRIIPWSRWTELVLPYYYKGEHGNKPFPLERMLRICRRPSTLKKLSRSGQYKARKAEYRKSSVRCKVEHVFGVVKNLFRCRKTRYRGKAKVDSQLKMVFALANLFLADTRYGLQA